MADVGLKPTMLSAFTGCEKRGYTVDWCSAARPIRWLVASAPGHSLLRRMLGGWVVRWRLAGWHRARQCADV